LRSDIPISLKCYRRESKTAKISIDLQGVERKRRKDPIPVIDLGRIFFSLKSVGERGRLPPGKELFPAIVRNRSMIPGNCLG
jgi:hypothetical protein